MARVILSQSKKRLVSLDLLYLAAGSKVNKMNLSLSPLALSLSLSLLSVTERSLLKCSTYGF